MGSSEHTPGPWMPQGRWATNKGFADCIEAPGRGIIGAWIDWSNEPAANARLIAAAPDYHANAERLHLEINGLHAAMRATSSEYRQSELCRQMNALIRDNAAAIAKARGEAVTP